MENKIRVLVSGHLPPPLGGVATFYKSLLASSLPHLVDLSFVQTSSQRRAGSSTGRATISNLLSAIKDCARFTASILNHRPEVCHVATAFGLSFLKHGICVVIARLLGRRVLLHPHCSLSTIYTNRSKWWQWIFRKIASLTVGIIALSSEWNQIRSILPHCQVYYLPNAIDLSPYRSISQEKKLKSKNEGPLKALYLGYLGKAKGSFDLLIAAKSVLIEGAGVMFDLVGEEAAPGAWKQLRQSIDFGKLDEIIKLHPPALGSHKISFYRDADIFIYPSYHEGMPIAVIEAMACGLPIIATNVGGLPDLIIDGFNGILVEPGQPEQLASAIYRLINDRELRYKMHKNNISLAFEKYDIEQRVPKLVDIYKGALVMGK